MATRIASLLSRPALLRTLSSHARLVLRLVRDPNVPAWLKAFLALPLLYVISPIDILPDIVPIVGQVDDIGVLLLALDIFVRYCPAEVVSHHRDAMERGQPYSPIPGSGVVIDAQFRRE